MIRWLFGKKEEEDSNKDDPEVTRARRHNKDAQREHREAMELIKLLDVEHKKNNYAKVVESALGTSRKPHQ